MIYQSKHKCARGGCEQIADPGEEICEDCEEHIKNVGPYRIESK